MAGRKNKNTVDYFPKWNPSKMTQYYLNELIDRKMAFKIFRNSSSGFINKPIVRNIIFNKYNNKCVYCESKVKLQIDHIKSVLYCFNNNLINYCNTESNLQLLCMKCNTSKTT